MRNSDHDAWNGDRDCTSSGGVDTDGVAVASDLDRRGREIPDSTPLAPPVGFSSGPSLADFVQRMIRQEVSLRAQEKDMETFEEADDFDIEDDPLDPKTPYEAVFDPAAKTLSWEEFESLRDGSSKVRLTAEEWEQVAKRSQEFTDAMNAGGGGPQAPSDKPPVAPSKGATAPIAKPPSEE